MSIFLSITTLFSLLSFLTTLLALVRVGSAAFLTNQLQHRIDFEVERANGSPQSPSPSSSSAVLAQAMADMQMQMKMQIKGLGGHGQGMTVKGDNTAMGTELMRIPGGMNWSIRKGHSGRPPSPLYPQQRPLSMAKLIMTRHSQRRPNRPPLPRRPPGLNLPHLPSSPLVGQVA